MSRATGWYGVPGGRPGGAVHVVQSRKGADDTGVGMRPAGPICGTRISPKARFQWSSRGVHWEYLECERCKKIIRREAQAELDAVMTPSARTLARWKARR